MGKGTPDGQGVGVLEKEAQPLDTRVLGVPPPDGTPSTGVSLSGEWIVVHKWGQLEWGVDVFETLEAAQQYYRLMSMHRACYLTYVIDRDL